MLVLRKVNDWLPTNKFSSIVFIRLAKTYTPHNFDWSTCLLRWIYAATIVRLTCGVPIRDEPTHIRFVQPRSAYTCFGPNFHTHARAKTIQKPHVLHSCRKNKKQPDVYTHAGHGNATETVKRPYTLHAHKRRVLSPDSSGYDFTRPNDHRRSHRTVTWCRTTNRVYVLRNDRALQYNIWPTGVSRMDPYTRCPLVHFVHSSVFSLLCVYVPEWTSSKTALDALMIFALKALGVRATPTPCSHNSTLLPVFKIIVPRLRRWTFVSHASRYRGVRLEK